MVWKYLSQVLQRTFMIGCFITPIDRDIYRKEDVYERKLITPIDIILTFLVNYRFIINMII